MHSKVAPDPPTPPPAAVPAPTRPVAPSNEPRRAPTTAPGARAGDDAPSGGLAARAEADAAGTAPEPLPEIGFSVEEPPVASAPTPVPGPPSAGSGGGLGGGDGRGRGGFMGLEAKGRRVAYVIDHSTSMSLGMRFEAARSELLRSIRSLSPDQEFVVVLFNSGIDMMPEEGMMRAGKEGKAAAARWIDRHDAGGFRDGSDAWPAMRLVLERKPDTVFLLTDGAFADESIVDSVRELNRWPSGAIIHAIALHAPDGERALQKIAKENGGEYTFIPAPVDRRFERP